MQIHKSALIYETQKLHINAVAQILVAVAQYSCMDLNPNRLIPSGRRQRVLGIGPSDQASTLGNAP